MNKLNKNIESLIIKVLSSEATTAEQKELDLWIAENPENLKKFQDYKSTWVLVGDKTDEERNWQKINEKINSNYIVPDYISFDNKEEKKEFRIGWNHIRNIAAFLVLLFAIGFLVKTYLFKNEAKTTVVAVTEIQNVKKANILPDGSEVFLNVGSKITYNNSFNKEIREIKLNGEGYFEVEHNKEKPFIIHCLNSTTKVVGTGFNINTDSLNNEVIITVTSGKVEFSFSNDENKKVVLIKDEEGRINTKTNEVTKSLNKDKNFIAWKTGELIFEELPLDEVIKDLKKYYKKEFEIKRNNIHEIKFTSKFNNKTLKDILTEVVMLTGIKCDSTKNKITIE